jgi:uncharacterized SAM-dependent methyltransferase
MENSYKYSVDDLARMATESGFELTSTWLDDQKRFSSNLLVASKE